MLATLHCPLAHVWAKAALWPMVGYWMPRERPLLVSALLHSATLVLCSMVLLDKVGFASTTPTLATMSHTLGPVRGCAGGHPVLLGPQPHDGVRLRAPR